MEDWYGRCPLAEEPSVFVAGSAKRVVDANAQLSSIDSPLQVRVDVAALIGFREQVVEVPETNLVVLCPEIGIGEVTPTAVVYLAVRDKQARDGPLLLRRQCLIESAASHDRGELGFGQVGVRQALHKVDVSGRSVGTEQVDALQIELVQIRDFHLEFEPVSRKNLVGADVDSPADKDGELLETAGSPVEIEVIVIPHSTDAQLHPLAIDALIDGGNGEGKGETLEELGLVRREQFAGLLIESSRDSSLDLVRNTDSGCIYRFPTEVVLCSVIDGVDEILVGNGQFLIAPSRDDAVTGKSVHSDGIRIGFQEMDVGGSLDWLVVDDGCLRDVIEVDERELRTWHGLRPCRSNNEIVHGDCI